MGDLWRDVRFAARMLTRTPGFSAVVVLALGLAMGVNSAVFSAANLFLMRGLPVAHPESLVAVSMGPKDQPRVWGQVSYPDYLAMRQETEIFSGLIAYIGDGGSISEGQPGRGGQERAGVMSWELVTGNAFAELGVRATLGRTLTTADDLPAAEPVAVISHRLWRGRLKGDPAVIGRKLYLGDFAVTVVGVMPPGWKGMAGALVQTELLGLWLPLAIRQQMYRGIDESFATDRGRRALQVLGRLQPGVTMARAEARLNALAQLLAREFPATNAGTKVTVASEIEARYGPQFPAVRLGFAVALFIAGLVLLISCANVANLQLARAARRGKELGIRVALGAGRGRIVRQLITESLLLALLGGGLGLLVAYCFGDILHAFLPSMTSRLDLDLHADARTLAWAFAAAILSGVAFGAAPAWRASRANVVTALKSDLGAEGQRRRTGLRQILVIAQVAISIVVLASGGLLLRSLEKIKNIDPGYRTESLLSALVNPSLFTDDVTKQHRFFSELERRLERYPGVEAVSSARYMPLVNVQGVLSPVVAEGQQPPPPNQAPAIDYSVVYRRYFPTVRTEILIGRDFQDSDHQRVPTVAIVNRELARRLFGRPEDALGRRFRVGPPQSPLLQVVGIARDGRYTDLLEAPRPWLFLPESLPWMPDANEGMRTVLVRAGDARRLPAIAEGLRNEVQHLDPRVPVEQLLIGEGHLVGALYAPRLAAGLGSMLGLLALALATMGIYSVTTYAVSQRAREIGIRMALGGQVRDVIGLVLGQGLSLIAIGVGVGALGALGVARLLRGFLFGISAADPLTFLAAVVILMGVALFATFLPARRATKVDPMVALRSQ
jgi:predicted permease